MVKKKQAGTQSGTEVLDTVEKKRGYVLPYHELFWSIDPELLAKYDSFYEHLTLKRNHLDDRTKELVWLGILISIYEEAGTIHLTRARKAGITDQEIADVIKLVQLARGFDAWLFVQENWKTYIPDLDLFDHYARFVDQATENMTLAKPLSELILIGIYSAIPVCPALKLHLGRAKVYGLGDEEIAEAISYIFIPRGGNVLIEAAQALKDAVQSGQLEPDGALKLWVSKK